MSVIEGVVARLFKPSIPTLFRMQVGGAKKIKQRSAVANDIREVPDEP